MSTNRNNTFPPIVNSFISAFTDNADEIKINFSLPITTDFSGIKHIDIRIVQQSNNKTVVDTNIYPDGIIYKNISHVSKNNDIYSININRNEVKKIFTTKVEEDSALEKNGWTANTYYKIQIRFGYGDLYSEITSFHQWKNIQKNLNNFSEWSNVIVTKAITKPIIKIENNYNLDILYSTFNMIPVLSTNAESSRFPTFSGSYKIENDSGEPLDKYRFRLYEGVYDDKNYIEPYLTSDWIVYNNEGQEQNVSYVQYTFNRPLNIIEPKYYTVIFDVITKNKYEGSSTPYVFTVNEGTLDKISHVDLVVEDNNNNGHYYEKFIAATKNVFNAYKRLFGTLEKDAVYLKKDGTDIYYLKNSNSKIFKKDIPENNQDRFNLNKIDITDYNITEKMLKENKNKLFLFINRFNVNNEIEEYNISLSYKDDYYFSQENNSSRKYLILKQPIYNIRDCSIYYVQDKDIKVLTLQQRINDAKKFEQNIRCDENGTLEIYLKNNPYFVETKKYDDITGFSDYDLVEKYQSLDGTYYLIRSDEKSNFTIWEDLAKFDFYNEKGFDNSLKMLYEDFTVESGVRYKYALQKASLKGYRSPPRFEFNDLDVSPAHWSNFQYTYIYAHGIQVRLDLDVKIQQFKRTRLFQKQDSLNSKYPVILRNGLANYAEFSLGGKITLHSDKDGSFLLREPETYDNQNGLWTGGYKVNGTDQIIISPDKYMDKAVRYKYYKSNTIYDDNYIYDGGLVSDLTPDSSLQGQLINKNNDDVSFIVMGQNLDFNGVNINTTLFKIPEYKDYSMFNTNHTDNNIYMERIYRDYIEKFLNDGDYKLYKSPTEGNMIVTLVNVSLTPNQQLNRLISDFNSTVYEVAENTIDNIKLYDINPLDVITNNMALAIKRSEKYKTAIGQVRGVFDGKYSKYMIISKEIYNKMISNEELKSLEPNKYFKQKNENEYYTYKKLPIEIIVFIEKEKRNNLFGTNNLSLEQYFNSQQKQIEEQYTEIINDFPEEASDQRKIIEKAKNIELSQFNQEKINKNPFPFNFSLQNNEFWDSNYDDIISWIKLQEEVNISNERKYKLNKITSISIELYPKHDIEQEILNLKQQTYDTGINKLARQLLLAQYELILQQYELSQSNPIILIANGTKEITVMPGKIYNLEDQDINSLHLKYSRPVLINYTCSLEEIDNEDNQTLVKQELMEVGQVAGVFTSNEKIINAYLYESNNQYNTIGRTIIDDVKNSKMNYNFYDSLNVLDVIREQVKLRIDNLISINSYNDLEEGIKEYFENINNYTYEEQIQEAKRIFSESKNILQLEKNENTDFWKVDNKYLIYRFEGLESFEIEADTNTEIIFNARDNYQALGGIILEDDGNQSRAIIGRTNKFILKLDNKDKINELNYINDCRFAQPTYALVNYKAIVSLEVRGGTE